MGLGFSLPQQKKKKNNDDDDLSNNKDCRINKYKKYGRKKVFNIQLLYIIASILWIILIIIAGLYKTTILGFLILSIPIFIFGFGFSSARHLTVEIEENLFTANSLSIGLVILLPLLTEVDKSYNKNKKTFTRAMVIAVVLAMLSLIDVWIQPKMISLTKHIKSIFQTTALTLLVYALYMYYAGRLDSNLL